MIEILTGILLSGRTLSGHQLEQLPEDNQCTINYCPFREEYTYGERYKQRLDNLKIKGYCRGCMGKNGRYDCSSFISVYLIEKNILTRRVNSYVLANYGIRLTKKEMQLGDLIIMMNKGTGSHHTAMLIGFEPEGIRIYDAFLDRTDLEERLIPYGDETYEMVYIGNPIEYGFKKTFYQTYRNFIH